MSLMLVREDPTPKTRSQSSSPPSQLSGLLSGSRQIWGYRLMEDYAEDADGFSGGEEEVKLTVPRAGPLYRSTSRISPVLSPASLSSSPPFSKSFRTSFRHFCSAFLLLSSMKSILIGAENFRIWRWNWLQVHPNSATKKTSRWMSLRFRVRKS